MCHKMAKGSKGFCLIETSRHIFCTGYNLNQTSKLYHRTYITFMRSDIRILKKNNSYTFLGTYQIIFRSYGAKHRHQLSECNTYIDTQSNLSWLYTHQSNPEYL